MYFFIKCRILDHGRITVGIHAHTGGLYCKILFSCRKCVIRIHRHCFRKFPAGDTIDFVRHLLCFLHRTVEKDCFPCSLIQQQHGYGSRHTAGTQDQDFFALHLHTIFTHGAVQSGHIGVISLIACLGPYQSIHRSDILCQRIDVRQIRDHITFIRNRHI